MAKEAIRVVKISRKIHPYEVHVGSRIVGTHNLKSTALKHKKKIEDMQKNPKKYHRASPRSAN